MSKKDTNKRVQKTKEQIRDEIRELSKKADSISGSQLNLLSKLSEEEDNFDTSALHDTANPDLSHKLYYNMRRIMMENLPEDKKLRRYVYDEKNLFLNRGKAKNPDGIRNSDGRMAYISGFLQEAFEITIKWLSSGGSAFDLYESFWRKNEELGFHDKTEG